MMTETVANTRRRAAHARRPRLAERVLSVGVVALALAAILPCFGDPYGDLHDGLKSMKDEKYGEADPKLQSAADRLPKESEDWFKAMMNLAEARAYEAHADLDKGDRGSARSLAASARELVLAIVGKLSVDMNKANVRTTQVSACWLLAQVLGDTPPLDAKTDRTTVLEEGIDICKRLRELRPPDVYAAHIRFANRYLPDMLLWAGDAYCKTGNPGRAAEYLLRARDMLPRGNMDVQYWLATAQGNLAVKNKDKGKPAFGEAEACYAKLEEANDQRRLTLDELMARAGTAVGEDARAFPYYDRLVPDGEGKVSAELRVGLCRSLMAKLANTAPGTTHDAHVRRAAENWKRAADALAGQPDLYRADAYPDGCPLAKLRQELATYLKELVVRAQTAGDLLYVAIGLRPDDVELSSLSVDSTLGRASKETDLNQRGVLISDAAAKLGPLAEKDETKINGADKARVSLFHRLRGELRTGSGEFAKAWTDDIRKAVYLTPPTPPDAAVAAHQAAADLFAKWLPAETDPKRLLDASTDAMGYLDTARTALKGQPSYPAIRDKVCEAYFARMPDFYDMKGVAQDLVAVAAASYIAHSNDAWQSILDGDLQVIDASRPSGYNSGVRNFESAMVSYQKAKELAGTSSGLQAVADGRQTWLMSLLNHTAVAIDAPANKVDKVDKVDRGPKPAFNDIKAEFQAALGRALGKFTDQWFTQKAQGQSRPWSDRHTGEAPWVTFDMVLDITDRFEKCRKAGDAWLAVVRVEDFDAGLPPEAKRAKTAGDAGGGVTFPPLPWWPQPDNATNTGTKTDRAAFVAWLEVSVTVYDARTEKPAGEPQHSFFTSGPDRPWRNSPEALRSLMKGLNDTWNKLPLADLVLGTVQECATPKK